MNNRSWGNRSWGRYEYYFNVVWCLVVCVSIYSSIYICIVNPCRIGSILLTCIYSVINLTYNQPISKASRIVWNRFSYYFHATQFHTIWLMHWCLVENKLSFFCIVLLDYEFYVKLHFVLRFDHDQK